MEINKYKIELTNGYVSGFYQVLEGAFDFEGQMSLYPNACDGYTKFINGNFVVDKAKKQELEDRQAKLNEIAELKNKLQESDYYKIVVDEGDRSIEYYSDLIAQRHNWRLRVRELEEELGL